MNRAALRIMGPMGTLDFHTVVNNYQEVLRAFNRQFPGVLLSSIDDSLPAADLLVEPFTPEQFSWLQMRREIAGFSYMEQIVHADEVEDDR